MFCFYNLFCSCYTFAARPEWCYFLLLRLYQVNGVLHFVRNDKKSGNGGHKRDESEGFYQSLQTMFLAAQKNIPLYILIFI